MASRLWPQPDSSIACAIVTAAGTPYCCCAASAPGAIALMNACCEGVSETDSVAGAGGSRLYRALDGAEEERAPEGAEEERALEGAAE